MPIIRTAPTNARYGGYIILATENQDIESVPVGRRFFPFALVITDTFSSTNGATALAFSSDSEDDYGTKYPLVDRMNKYISGEELYQYAGNRRCIDCVYDQTFQVVRVNSPICPVTLTLPSDTSATSETDDTSTT